MALKGARLMSFTIKDIATALEAKAFGAVDLLISGAAEPAEAGPQDLALAMEAKYAEGLAKGQAKAAIVWDGADWQGLGLEAAIMVTRPRLAMSGLTTLMDKGPGIAQGIHPSAVIDPSAEVGPGAAIGPLAVIGPGVRIGEGARIGPHVSIAEDAVIGRDALILARVCICARVLIGDRVILQPGAIIGADGFSFVTPEKSRVEEARGSLGTETETTNSAWIRIHSLGGVEIGDDVEIGANTTVDRGTIRATRIGHRTKLDNLVQIGHNVVIGEDSLLCAQVAVAGSTRIGNRVVLGGQCGVSDNITIGDDVVAGGASKILSRVPKGRVVLGYPAMKMEQFIEASQNWRRLPRLMDDIKTLKKSVPLQDDED